MKRIATAVVLIPLVLAAVIFSPGSVFATLLGFIALISLREFLRLSSALGASPRQLPYVFVVLIFSIIVVAPYFKQSYPALMTFLPAAILLFPFAIIGWCLGGEDLRASLQGGSLALLGTYYITIPLLCVAFLRERTFVGNYFVILLFVLVWGGDIAALYVGKLIGRHRLAPRVSPGKTWEGAIASALFAVVLAFAITEWVAPKLSGLPATKYFAPDTWDTTITVFAPPFWVPLLLALLVNISAQIGDLAESMLKRAANVKDSGTLLPGHGGMLDRIDALLFAAPVGMLIFLFTERFFAAEPDLRLILR